MAEGDSIRRLALRLDAGLAGDRVSVRTPGRRRPAGRAAGALEGATLTSTESRGKHLLLRFDNELVLHSHLGMRGSWQVAALGDRWRRPASEAWIALRGGRAEAVNFGGSSMRIVPRAELARDPRLARLGPDVLDDCLNPAAGAAVLRRAGADRELGEALLDQSVLAGIGNIYKSEACWAAGLDPWRPIGDLDGRELESVFAAAQSLMAEAVERGRSAHAVYRRAGRPCGRCATAVRSRAQGDSARVTYWCPACQG